ncbi:MAG: hypothetical protein JW958_08995 [Candidatus Eisenbacteria bacterium]|nr:hypothetical protein [Candidatus Eisenbacteria bacterium]
MKRYPPVYSAIVLFLGLLLLGGCGGGDGDDNPAGTTDVTPPAAVDDLGATAITGSSITLAWAAPGDDGSTGTAASYDIRYSTSSIDTSNWASATQATGEPSPQAAGTTQSFTLTGLADSTAYWAAIVTADEAANLSPLSNVVACTTSTGTVPALDLTGYWDFRLVYDSSPDPEEIADCPHVEQTGTSLVFTPFYYPENPGLTGSLTGDSLHLTDTGGEWTFSGKANADSMWGNWSEEEPGEEEKTGTWTAVKRSTAPDSEDWVAVNADVICGRTTENDYHIIAQLDDEEGIVESATLSGDLLTGSFDLSNTLYAQEEGTDEWWTDFSDSDLIVSQGSSPSFPLDYTVHIEFAGGSSRDVPITVGRYYDIETPCAWRTVFFDDFNSTTLDPEWSLYTGDATVYTLTGTVIAVDDSPAYTDGPFFIYADSTAGEKTRLTCEVRTEEMNGEVQLVFVLRASSSAGNYVFGLWDGLRIKKETGGGEELLAYAPSYAMGDYETLVFECIIEEGDLTFTVRNLSGGVVAEIEATDPSPFVGGAAGFGGEIDGTTGEYLHFDDFKLEVCE